MQIKETPNIVLREELEDLKQRIIANHRQAGQVASGKTIASMQVNVDGDTGELVGRKQFWNLETGTAPWRNPTNQVPYSFHAIIEQWIKDKGLNLNAWAVAYKIIHEGTELYRQGGRADIYSNEIQQTIDNIGRRVLVIYDKQITETIKLNTPKQ
jgi:hypothetical protein